MSTIGAVENAATDRLSIGAMCIVMAALMAAAVLLQLARDRRYTVPGSDIDDGYKTGFRLGLRFLRQYVPV